MSLLFQLFLPAPSRSLADRSLPSLRPPLRPLRLGGFLPFPPPPPPPSPSGRLLFTPARVLLKSRMAASTPRTANRTKPIKTQDYTADEVRRIAREKFGYDGLRYGQEEAIRAVLAGHDTL